MQRLSVNRLLDADMSGLFRAI